MITRSDIQAIHTLAVAERRNRLTNPPSDAELLAYMRDELPPAEADRVRELLLAYPELVRAMTEPFPQDDIAPGETGYVSDEEVERRLEQLQRTLPGSGRRLLSFRPRASWAVAATLAVAFCGLAWQYAQVRREALAPHVIGQPQLLASENRRGASGAAATVVPQADDYVVSMAVANPPDFASFRIEIVTDGNDPQTLWKSGRLTLSDDKTLTLAIPRRLLNPGTYHLIVSGENGNVQEQLASYSIRVPER